MAPRITGFEDVRVGTAEGVELHAAVGGSGTPIVLLHGFPQTHLMWRHIAAELAGEHMVICPDLRGYGRSSKPLDESPETYSKRTMALDVIRLAGELGHERFALAGDDRGALVAFRAGLDHPERISHLALLDILPTLDMWSVLHGADARVAWHLYLMGQPPGLPERRSSGVPRKRSSAPSWTSGRRVRKGSRPRCGGREYLGASAAAIASIVADYRQRRHPAQSLKNCEGCSGDDPPPHRRTAAPPHCCRPIHRSAADLLSPDAVVTVPHEKLDMRPPRAAGREPS